MISGFRPKFNENRPKNCFYWPIPANNVLTGLYISNCSDFFFFLAQQSRIDQPMICHTGSNIFFLLVIRICISIMQNRVLMGWRHMMYLSVFLYWHLYYYMKRYTNLLSISNNIIFQIKIKGRTNHAHFFYHFHI